MTWAGRFNRIGVATVAAFGVVLMLALVLLAAGASPIESFKTLLEGAFGSSFAWRQTLLKTVPLALTGLAVAIPMSLRLWNIGAEGQLHLGAIGATAVALAFPSLPAPILLPIMVIAGAIAGSLWALLPAIPRALWGVSEIITTLLLNGVGLLLVTYLVTGPWRTTTAASFPVTDPFSDAAKLPFLGTTRIHIGVFIPVIAALILYFVLRSSKFGYEVRAIGANPHAARVVGMSTLKAILIVMVVGGALAGIAGMVEVSATFGRLRTGISPGYGFMGIVIATLARGNVLGTVLIALLFGGFVGGGLALQTLGISQAFVFVIQGLILLGTVVVTWILGFPVFRRREQPRQLTRGEQPSTP